MYFAIVCIEAKLQVLLYLAVWSMREATKAISIIPTPLTSMYWKQSILTLISLHEMQIYVILNEPENVLLADAEEVTWDEGWENAQDISQFSNILRIW